MPSIKEQQKINLTGNPFVDTGLAVIAHQAKLKDIHELRLEHVKQVYKDGSELAYRNINTKSFGMIFTSNSLLTNPGIRNKEQRIEAYKEITQAFLELINCESTGTICESCGQNNAIDFPEVSRKALKKSMGKNEPRYIGRDWFPLAGSISEAQALPSGSRSVHLCAKCLFAVHYLPWAVPLYKGKLACFQSNNIAFWYGIVQTNTRDIVDRIDIGKKEIKGKGTGAVAVLEQIFNYLEDIAKQKRRQSLTEEISLYIWLFSNAGTGADCVIEEIPSTAIRFLYDTAEENFEKDVKRIFSVDKSGSLLTCITEGEDFWGLYPRKGYKGVSPEFFVHYHTCVTKISQDSLLAAYQIANLWMQDVNQQELKRLQRSKSFDEKKNKNQAKKKMLMLAEQGEFTLNHYLNLFQADGLYTKYVGWEIIRYYLNHLEWPDQMKPVETKDRSIDRIDPIFQWYAVKIFVEVIADQGRQSAKIFKIKEEKQLWKIFIQLAKKEWGFTYGHWKLFSNNEEGAKNISEVLFRLSIQWLEWLANNEQAPSEPGAMEVSIFDAKNEESGLPEHIHAAVKDYVLNYISQKGLKRFDQDIIQRFHHRDLDLYWLVEMKFVTPSEWEDFCKDEIGNSIGQLRLFQLCLLLSNLYRKNRTGGILHDQ